MLLHKLIKLISLSNVGLHRTLAVQSSEFVTVSLTMTKRN